MSKYYFQKHDDTCYPLIDHLEHMVDNNIEEMEVFEAKVERGSDYFFCLHFTEVGEKGYCGASCEAYEPRNGKSGICKHYGYTYERGKKIVLKNKV